MPGKKSPKNKHRAKRNTAQWILNASKSLGMTGLEVVKEIIPNASDIASTTADGVKEIQKTIRSATSTNQIQKQLSRNRYVRLGQTALKNALEDLKSGNFYDNTTRGFGGDSNSGMNFGDFDAEDGSVNVINNDMSEESKAYLGEISKRQSQTLITSVQAQINTNIATTSAQMALNQEIADQVVGRLDQINSNLSAIVEFNNENMAKFIQTATTYYEKTGAQLAREEEQAKKELTSSDVIRGKKGGLKLTEYRKLIAQQGQEYIKNSTLGMATSMIDSMGDLLVQSPLKLITSQLIEHAIPTLVKDTAKSLDKAIGNAMTSGLQQLYDTWGQQQGTGMADIAKRFLGETFGLRMDKKRTIELGGKITADPAIFDGYTRHAIVEQIPKYLRESTAYLRTITEYLTGSDSKDSLKRAEAFDFQQGFYRSLSDISNEVYGGIRDTVANAMRESEFGKSLAAAGNARSVDNASYQSALDNFFYELARSGSPNTRAGRENWMAQIDQVLGNVQTDDATKAYLRSAVETSWKNRRGGLNMGSAILNAQAEMRNRIQDMENNPEAYNLYAVNRTNEQVEDVVGAVIYGHDEPEEVDKRINRRGSLIDVLDNVNYLLERGINVHVTGKTPYKTNDLGFRSNRNAVPRVPVERGEPEQKPPKEKRPTVSQEQIDAELNEILAAQEEDPTTAGWLKGVRAKGSLALNAIYDIMEGRPIQGARNLGSIMRNGKTGPLRSKVEGRAKGILGGIQDLLSSSPKDAKQKIKDFFGLSYEEDDILPTGVGMSQHVRRRKASPNSFIEKINVVLRDGLVGYYEGLFGKKYDPDKDGDIKEQVKRGLQERLDKLKILKENPEYRHTIQIGKGAAVGGILGSIVGGPLVGGLLGSVTGMISQSNAWKDFIYGKETETVGEDGTVKRTRSGGIKDKLLRIWNEHSSKLKIADTDPDTGKRTLKKNFRMGATGASLGLIASMFTPLGPVGGALAGLTSSIIFGSNRIHDYIFGKMDKDGNKEKVGLLERMGNAVASFWADPLKNAAKKMVRTGHNFITDAIIEPISIAMEPFAIMGARITDAITERVHQFGTASLQLIQNTAYKIMELPIFRPISKVIGLASAGMRRATEYMGAHSPLMALGKFADQRNRKASMKRTKRDLKAILDSDESTEEQKKNARIELARLREGDEDARERAETNYYKSNYREVAAQRKDNRAKRMAENQLASEEDDAKLRNVQFITAMTRGRLREDTPENREEAMRIFEDLKKKKRFRRRIKGFDKDFSFYDSGATISADQGEGTPTAEDPSTAAQQSTATNTEQIAKTSDLIHEEVEAARKALEELNKKIFANSQQRRDDLVEKLETAVTDDGIAEAKKDLEEFDEREKRNPYAHASEPLQEKVNFARKRYLKLSKMEKKARRKEWFGGARDYLWDKNKVTGTGLKGAAWLWQHLAPGGYAWEGLGKGASFLRQFLPVIGYSDRQINRGKRLLDEENVQAAEAAQKAKLQDEEKTDGINNVINAVTSLLNAGGSGKYSPKDFPRFAKGGRKKRSGWAVTGEDGPELTYLPGGTSIFPNSKAIKVEIAGFASGALDSINKFFDQNPLSTAVQATTGILPVYTMGTLNQNTDNKDAILATAEHEGNIHPDDVDNDINDAPIGVTGEEKEDKETKGIFDMLLDWGGEDGIIGKISNFLGSIKKFVQPLAGMAAIVGAVLPAIAGFLGLKKAVDDIMNTKNSNENTAEVDENGVVQLNEDGSVKQWDSSEEDAKMTTADKFANWVAPKETKIDMETGKATTENVITTKSLDKVNAVTKGAIGGAYISSKLVPTMGKWGAKQVAAPIVGAAKAAKNTGATVVKTGTDVLFGKTRGAAIRKSAASVATGAKDAATNTAAKLAETAASKGSSILKSFKDAAVDLASKLGDKIIAALRKFGFDGAADTVTDFCGKIVSNFTDDALARCSGKIADFMASLGKKANVIGWAIELAGIGIGAINGASNPGYLFECDMNNENLGSSSKLLMHAISAAIGGLKGSTIGSFVELVCMIFNYDWAKVLANTIFNAIMGKEAEAGLEAAKEDFKDDYDDYVQKEYEKYKEYTESQGQTAATFEEFVDSSAATTFEEYREQENQNLTSKMGNAIKNWFKPNQNATKKSTDATPTPVASTYLGATNTTQTTTTPTASSYLTGGNGEGDAVPYYSQNDPRWKNAAYGSDSTMGKAGCGPTAMAMALSGATGKNYNPMEMAGLASTQGYRDNTGTNQAFIDIAARATGVGSKSSIKPDSGFLNSELSKGKPVVLLGKKGGYGADRSAFTDAGHYVVATGKTNDGKVIIKDPRGKGYSGRYDERQLLGESAKAWSIGGRGEDATTTSSTGSNRVTAKDVLKVALNEVGYVEKATNEQLDDPKANPGRNNYTKYGEWMGLNGNYWCAMFVCWCLAMAANGSKEKAAQLLGGKLSAACQAILDQMKKANRITEQPEPGDLIFFDTGKGIANHIGIVTEVSGTKVFTVEGNTSPGSTVRGNDGEVAKKSYDLGYSNIIGYARPFYDDVSDFQGLSTTGATVAATADGALTSSTTGTDANTSSTKSTSVFDIFSNIGSKLSSIGDRIGKYLLTGNKEDLKEQPATDTSTDGDTGVLDSATANEAQVQAFNFDGSDNAEALWNYFKSLGYSDEATAAIIGNLQGESGTSLNPATIQKPNGPAAGLAQWENYNQKSGRWLELSNFAASQGKDWTDLGSQAQFIHHELSGSQKTFFTKNSTPMKEAGAAPTTYEEWKQSKDLEMATRQFEGAFERAGKPRINDRIAYAKGIYNKYAGTQGEADFAETTDDTSTTEGGSGDYFGGFGDAVADSGSSSIGNTETKRVTVRQNVSSASNQPLELLKSIVEILGTIADNTGTTSSKLDKLKMITSSTQNSNQVLVSGGNQAPQEREIDTGAVNRYNKALQISKGGL